MKNGTPQKRRNFTFALQKENGRVINIVERYPKYAYICHDQDDANFHYHYYIEFNSPRSFNSVANELGIPVNMLEPVWNKKGLLEYLTHKNSPDKHQYDTEEIITNMDLVKDTSDLNMSKEEYDLIVSTADDYLEGRITRLEMFEILHYTLCDIKPARLLDLTLRSSGKGGPVPFSVPRSTFHNGRASPVNSKTMEQE